MYSTETAEAPSSLTIGNGGYDLHVPVMAWIAADSAIQYYDVHMQSMAPVVHIYISQSRIT